MSLRWGASTYIVDFVSSSLLVEEEVAQGGGLSLRLNTRQKLEKVSPAVWITANSRMLCKLIEEKDEFDTVAYPRYTEMMGNWLHTTPGSTLHLADCSPV